MGDIKVGISSWTEKTLVRESDFYPRGTKNPEGMLRYYASQFPLVEADAGFHGRNAESWNKRVDTAAERFDYRYSQAELAEWVPRLRAPSERAEETHAIMNNCHRDYAIASANQLAALLSLEFFVTWDEFILGYTSCMPRSTEYPITVGERGRLVLPAPVREQLNIQSGERFLAHVEGDGSIRLVSFRSIAERNRGLFSDLASGRLLVDELIADRRAEAARDALA